MAQHWINQEGWDVAGETRVISKNTGAAIDLRLDWAMVKGCLQMVPATRGNLTRDLSTKLPCYAIMLSTLLTPPSELCRSCYKAGHHRGGCIQSH